MSIAVDAVKKAQAIQKLAHAKESMYDRKQWLKLLTGEIPWRSALNILFTQMQLLVKSYYRNGDSRLSADIKRYFHKNRHLSLFFSSTDPGIDILKIDARNALKKGIAEKKIILQIFQDADHTFSRIEQRDELIGRLGEHLTALTKIDS